MMIIMMMIVMMTLISVMEAVTAQGSSIVAGSKLILLKKNKGLFIDNKQKYLHQLVYSVFAKTQFVILLDIPDDQYCVSKIH